MTPIVDRDNVMRRLPSAKHGQHWLGLEFRPDRHQIKALKLAQIPMGIRSILQFPINNWHTCLVVAKNHWPWLLIQRPDRKRGQLVPPSWVDHGNKDITCRGHSTEPLGIVFFPWNDPPFRVPHWLLLDHSNETRSPREIVQSQPGAFAW
jgi:hypothetical protein